MKSKFEDLQCPCGCELAAEHRLELVYKHLKYLGFEVQGMVNCEQGRNSMLTVRVHDIHPDVVNKHIGGMKHQLGFEITCWYDAAGKYWICDVNYKHGVLFA